MTAMTISDTKRREVARRLREYVDIPDDWWADTYPGFYVEKCVFGDVERHKESELFVRLADLIDPGDTSQGRRDIVACDRDALLDIADECDMMRDDGLPIGSYEIDRIARRIREALGVCCEG